ncbi:hypothetical protein [Parvibaculum sp.]|uniref:hypothetical protein n=1 Tax=Parvibaculum sp. TaxID=2024848 RepID=UPI001B21EF69|nr:hypothetical protein [Parvibaculum sp.]MBO6666638.1 hypothetical protein [Parvibaculum sp.]MBO6692521.1 hypothetical protein [Parvibaculum sp.]MBO6713259.1 hypothetical protein [Parvibaculum sp.]
MRYPLLCAILFAGAAFAMPAAAAEYKCNCYKDAKSGLESNDDVNMDCVDTYTSFDNSASVQESQIKVYIDGDNKVQSDNDTKLRFRPRDGKCLLAVYDGNAETLRWGGVYCNDDSYKEISPFNFEKQPTVYDANGNALPDTYTATYKAETDGKHYKGFLMFTKAGDGKKYMQALCLENR